MDDDLHNDSASGSARLWLIIAVVVVLTLVAVVMVPDKKPPAEAIPLPAAMTPLAPEQVAPPATLEPTLGEPPAPPAEPVVSEPQPAAAAVTSTRDGDRARAFLQQHGAGDVAQLLVQANEFSQQQLPGDAWLLYFKAAREGSAEAAMALAEQADPAYFDARRSALSGPDVVQAHKWYEQARQAGNHAAAERLRQLDSYLRKRAAAGDEQAMLLIRQWNKN